MKVFEIDPKKVKETLVWAVEEMERRYRMLAENNVRSVEVYNKLREEENKSKANEGAGKIPQIVIFVGELEDLMMDDPEAVEVLICQIAQLGHAAGIYLIYAMTRPDTGIITDLIKVNIPSRAAFKVSTEDGSKYVLDMEGAQLLQEDGDMLFWLQGYVSSLRVPVAQVSDSEIQKVVEY